MSATIPGIAGNAKSALGRSPRFLFATMAIRVRKRLPCARTKGGSFSATHVADRAGNRGELCCGDCVAGSVGRWRVCSATLAPAFWLCPKLVRQSFRVFAHSPGSLPSLWYCDFSGHNARRFSECGVFHPSECLRPRFIPFCAIQRYIISRAHPRHAGILAHAGANHLPALRQKPAGKRQTPLGVRASPCARGAVGNSRDPYIHARGRHAPFLPAAGFPLSGGISPAAKKPSQENKKESWPSA